MSNAVIPFYAEKPADIAFVIQVNNSQSFPKHINSLIDVTKGINSVCKRFNIPKKYDIYYANGEGEIFHFKGFQTEIVNGYNLFQMHRYVVPIGSAQFEALWNQTFGIYSEQLLIKLPDSVLSEKQIGGRAYLRRGLDLRKKKVPLRGRHICIRKAGVAFDECHSHIVLNTKKEIAAFFDETYGKNCDDVFLITPLQNWESKWRYIVFNHKICDVKACSIDKTLIPDIDDIKNYIKEITEFNNSIIPFVMTVGVEYNNKKRKNITHLLEVSAIDLKLLEHSTSVEVPSIVAANYLATVHQVNN